MIHSNLISTIPNVIAPSIVDNFNLKQSIPPSTAQTVGNKNRKKELMKIFKILTNQVSAEKKVRTVNKDTTVPPSSKKIVPKGAAKNLIPPKLNLNPNVSKDQSLLNPPQIKGLNINIAKINKRATTIVNPSPPVIPINTKTNIANNQPLSTINPSASIVQTIAKTNIANKKLLINASVLAPVVPINTKTIFTNKKPLTTINTSAPIVQAIAKTNIANKKPLTVVNPSPTIQVNTPKIIQPKTQIKIINPAVPSPLIPSKTPQTKLARIPSNLIANPIIPLLGSSINNLMPKEEFHESLFPLVDEKTDTDIKELLKGHRNILEETKIFKKKRKATKSLKDFLSPLQIATYNTYNPTPDVLAKIVHQSTENGNKINPSPVHHNLRHPVRFNDNLYHQKMKNHQLSIMNAIQTAKLLSLVQSELQNINKNDEEKKIDKKGNKEKKENKNKKSLKKKKVLKNKKENKNKKR